MARDAGTITMPLPRLTVRVKLPRAYGVRMWCVARLIGLAGLIGPHGMVVEIDGDQPKG